MTKEEFIAAAISAARTSSALSGLPAGITVAQAALESGWGNSQLARLAHNYFGIKAHGGCDAIEMPTCEVIGGQTLRTRARFAKYSSMEACFRERDAIILRLACYAEARAAAHDPEAFTRALAKHWATDPRYAEKLLSVYQRFALDKLDATCKTQTEA